MPSHRKLTISILVASLTVGFYASELRSAAAELPPPAAFASPADEYQQMTGDWCGKWNNGPKIRLSVEKVAADGTATGIYEYGKAKRTAKFKGAVNNHVLHITLPGASGQGAKWVDADVAMWLSSKDQMVGTWESNMSKKSKPAQLGVLTMETNRCS